MKIGMGYDIHRLSSGRRMVIGGVGIDHPVGPVGHSDGDVLVHAVCDAILGAMGKGDIGQRFPDTDPSYKDADSMDFLKDVASFMAEEGFTVGNLDCIVVAEEPRIGPHRDEIAASVSAALGVTPADVSVKGKTSEGLGSTGKGESIEAYAIVLLKKKES